jgi:hypothetical protein
MRYAILAFLLCAATPAEASDLCYMSGKTTYRLVKSGPADVRIRVEANNAAADIRIQLVEQAEIADFILADDADDDLDPCASAKRITTVRADENEKRPDVTVMLSSKPDTADYKLFVNSTRYTSQDAAALLAAIWKSSQRRNVAARR